jgi:hypothetical protein
MNELRKAAYRGILYHFLLGIRCPPTALTEAEDTKAMHIGRQAGPTAYLLHNLALASVDDFVGFNEDAFWQAFEAFSSRNHTIPVEHLRTQFEAALLVG